MIIAGSTISHLVHAQIWKCNKEEVEYRTVMLLIKPLIRLQMLLGMGRPSSLIRSCADHCFLQELDFVPWDKIIFETDFKSPQLIADANWDAPFNG
jgi:hypothetical protein